MGKKKETLWDHCINHYVTSKELNQPCCRLLLQGIYHYIFTLKFFPESFQSLVLLFSELQHIPFHTLGHSTFDWSATEGRGVTTQNPSIYDKQAFRLYRSNLTREMRLSKMPVGTYKAMIFPSTYLLFPTWGSCGQWAQSLGEEWHTGLALIKAGLRWGFVRV